MSKIGTVTLTSGIEVGVRPYRAGADDPIIYAPWCNYIRRVPPFGDFTPEEFREHKQDVLEYLVAKYPPTVICHPEQHEVVNGWLCGSGLEQTLHFLYVKDAFRGIGVARALLGLEFPYLGKMQVHYTHQSRQSRSLADKWGMVYNPYRVCCLEMRI